MRTKLRIFLLVAVTVAMLVSLVGCKNNDIDKSGLDNSLSIVSTASDICEILSGLGFGENIVLADSYSAGIENIDEAICTLDYLNPDIEYILSIEPDIVFVSSSSTDGTTDPYSTLLDLGVEVVYVPTAESIDDIKSNIGFIAEAVDASENADALTKSIDDAIADISLTVSVLSNNSPKVYFELSAAPWLYSFGSGTFLNEIIEICGGINIYADEQGWLSNSEESVILANPEVILTSVEYDGYDYTEILSRPGWENVDAVKNRRVYQIDANSTSRGSQNIVKAMYEILHALYPQSSVE